MPRPGEDHETVLEVLAADADGYLVNGRSVEISMTSGKDAAA
jgi:hypothetical protein